MNLDRKWRRRLKKEVIAQMEVRSCLRSYRLVDLGIDLGITVSQMTETVQIGGNQKLSQGESFMANNVMSIVCELRALVNQRDRAHWILG
jgi:hypothetical protein